MNKIISQQPEGLDLGRIKMLGDVLQRQTTAHTKVRFPMDYNTALHLLGACYMTEVNKRNQECIFDKDTVRHLSKVTKYMTSEASGFGIMFGGDYGRGKTIMMHALRRAVNHIYNTGGFREMMPAFWQPNFEIHDAVDILEIARDRKEFKRICGLNMLGIDDLGVEKLQVNDYGTVLEPIQRLLEHRYNRQLFTVVTTNLPPKEHSKRFGERIADRLSEMFYMVVFSSEGSYRKSTAKAGNPNK